MPRQYRIHPVRAPGATRPEQTVRLPRGGGVTCPSTGGGGAPVPADPAVLRLLYPNATWDDFPDGVPVITAPAEGGDDTLGLGVDGDIGQSVSFLYIARNAPAGAVVVWSVSFVEDPASVVPGKPQITVCDNVLMLHFPADFGVQLGYALGVYTITATVNGTSAGTVTLTTYETPP